MAFLPNSTGGMPCFLKPDDPSSAALEGLGKSLMLSAFLEVLCFLQVCQTKLKQTQLGTKPAGVILPVPEVGLPTPLLPLAKLFPLSKPMSFLSRRPSPPCPQSQREKPRGKTLGHLHEGRLE